MKRLQLLTFLLLGSVLFSCGPSSSDQQADAEGFKVLESDLQEKFGKNAYYTELSIGYDAQIGLWIGATVTEDPESMKMAEWSMSQDTWTQSAEVQVEVPEGSKPSDFMFQLKGKLSLQTLGELVEKSQKHLAKEKDIKNSVLSLASIKFPDDGDISKAEYLVQLEPENGGSSFNYSYTLDGTLIEMNY